MWQKCNDRVTVYVHRDYNHKLGMYIVQLYRRSQLSKGDLGCDLEFRSRRTEGLFLVAEAWLERYADGDLVRISNDDACPSNPSGWWTKSKEEQTT